ncbi:HesA/MoeB/ThiF family protein [Leptospirillum ferriphilum]|jgi:molybdopterin/thiamine biosynthesis adenylyltransferase|uniref:Molybdopterin-synthase adenylyltransferase n=1 Tax=Leptospirillum sp. Group II '5-way CG' TaxID=419541 RepID=B6AQP8_9BACT|nr:MAG: Putative ThiF family protein [Leptospirillum sp. Group II '5-way CG']MCL5259889.1 molybdopterin-synthase adenylyltransferase MoeB [Nitrospirota bacterium]
MEMTEEQILRYSRHILLPEVGGAGQAKLLSSSVLIIGAGGLGSPVALYLAAAGVGHLGIVDMDRVDLSNLQRQIIHRTGDVGRPKVTSAKEKITSLNPDVRVTEHPTQLMAENAQQIASRYDILVDGTDNFAAKFLINDLAVLLGKPLVHAGILRFVGQVMSIFPGQSACYRCLFRDPPPAGAVPTCSEAGILGVIAGVIGTIQATEVLKILLGRGDVLSDRLLTYDALPVTFRNVRVKRNPRCPVCGDHPTITELHDYEQPVCITPALP